MTEHGATSPLAQSPPVRDPEPVRGPKPVPFRPWAGYAGFRAFGDGGGAVLIDPRVARELRLAAQTAAGQGRAAGGLLYGGTWADDRGRYLVVAGFLEAGPDSDRDRELDGPESFALSPAALRRLRDDAAAAYPASVEVGWWRTLAELGDFGPRDLQTQRDLVAPGGVGLLVYGSGMHWGTAYLGPDGHAPDSAGTVPPASAGPEAGGTHAADTEAAHPDIPHPDDPEPDNPEPDNAGPGPTAALAVRPPAALTPAPRAARPPVISPLLVPRQEWGARRNSAFAAPGMPGDAKLVVGVSIAAMVVAGVLIGMLMSNPIVAVIAVVVLCLVVLGFVWMSRL
jgi:hypothetical protein